ncbi:PilN domain-containing protein [Ferrimonas aestuarii]|uniref:Type IV pilus assembly protein PilN n=1 Tax=Ferrimonas aestuarii TaxID=2569539 RepID=A0A4U1BDQ1_9GAMM|nr:PilN domain-containing protein [Ferrimonas aestuarii]TKB49130.1 hypothetical protein FCL42_21135 [Ferrimonas aestuarii]
MAAINLLPWREKRRRQAGRRFQFTLMATLLCAVVVLVLGIEGLSLAREQQRQRNLYLQQQIAQVDARNQQAQSLAAQFEALQQAQALIQHLHQDSLSGVRLFNALHQVIDDGVQLQRLQLEGVNIELDGFCHSNNQLSDLLRAMEASPWLTEPMLESIEAGTLSGRRGHFFRLTVSLVIGGGRES